MATDIADLQKRDASPITQLRSQLDRMKGQLALALPKHMNADRMARLVLTAFSSSQDLQRCDMRSIAASLMIAGQLGLEPGVNGQGYLIPYKGTCTFVPGWKGLVDLVARAGRATVWTGVVMPGDEFDYQLGDAPFCRHKPGDEVSGRWTHVYAIGRVRDAQMPIIEVWTRGKVERHLAEYNKVGGRHYAKQGENNFEMYGRKVALLQVLKYMPQSVELATATELADKADTGQGVVLDGDLVRFVDEQPQQAQQQASQPPAFDIDTFCRRIAACTDLETLQVLSDEAEELPDGPDRDRAMQALIQRDRQLASAPAPTPAPAPTQPPAASPAARVARRGAGSAGQTVIE
ncbi:recombinase RecT [Pseudaquabacterium rugosum]|uniref:Recombinase RecT n=1 Tax=Pseudaquabacterium rugosum TaxID=2984194 RepID=A0ABU9B589_9BURK